MATGYAITISAVDAASGVLERINKHIEALNKRVSLAAEPFKRLGENFEKLTKVSGIDKIVSGFSELAKASGEAFKKMMEIIEPLAAITGVASLAGMYKLVSVWGEFGHVLGNTARRAGVSTDDLYLLQRAAELSGVSTQAVSDGVTALNDNMRNAQFGEANNFLLVLRNLGVSYDELKKQTPVEQLKTLATALTNVKNVTDKARYARELFGSEGMFPFLNKGGEGIQKSIDRMRELVGVYDVEKAEHFREAEIELTASVIGLGNAIATVLGPELTPVLHDITGVVVWMRNWVTANETWLQTEISTKIKEFGDYLKTIDWHEVGQGFLEFGHSIEHAATALGGWIPAGEKVLAFFAVTWLAGMLAPIAQVVTALLALPVRAGIAAAGATTALGPIATLLGRLGLIMAAWEAAGQLDKLTSTNADGTPLSPTADMLHHFLFDNPLHWLPGYDDKKPDPIPVPSGSIGKNSRVMGQIFQEEGGFTKEGAAALVGSGIRESGLGTDPKTGMGAIFQWDEPRQRRIAAKFGKLPSQMTPEEQARAVIWEIKSQPEFALLGKSLRTSHDLEGNNRAVTRVFEAPADTDKETPLRLRLSQGVLDDLNAVARGEPAPNAAARGEPAPMPTKPGTPGAAGANGRVDMTVRLLGAPAAQVTAQSTGDVGLNIMNPGILGQ